MAQKSQKTLKLANKTVDILKFRVRSALDQHNAQYCFEMV